jgi:DNA-binding XRE family transcriptional regulator
MRFCGGSVVPRNNVQRYRESLMMSKAELARKAGLSSLTIDRIEAGRPCRLDTKRKILLALGLRVSDKDQVFGMLAIAREERNAEPASRVEAEKDGRSFQ